MIYSVQLFKNDKPLAEPARMQSFDACLEAGNTAIESGTADSYDVNVEWISITFNGVASRDDLVRLLTEALTLKLPTV
jgi:hypothetical protein